MRGLGPGADMDFIVDPQFDLSTWREDNGLEVKAGLRGKIFLCNVRDYLGPTKKGMN
jgi:hypothetical protein